MNQQGGNDHRNILWSIFTKECCWPGGGQTLITSRTRIQLSHRGRLSNPVITPKPVSLRTWWIVLKFLSVSESVASELYPPYVCLCWMIFLKKKKTPTKNKKTTNTHMCLWFGANMCIVKDHYLRIFTIFVTICLQSASATRVFVFLGVLD